MKYLIYREIKKIKKLLKQIMKKEQEMSIELDNLTAVVAETKTAVDSAIILIEGLAARLRDIADDPAAIQALATELDAKSDALAAAVAANPLP